MNKIDCHLSMYFHLKLLKYSKYMLLSNNRKNQCRIHYNRDLETIETERYITIVWKSF